MHAHFLRSPLLPCFLHFYYHFSRIEFRHRLCTVRNLFFSEIFRAVRAIYVLPPFPPFSAFLFPFSTFSVCYHSVMYIQTDTQHDFSSIDAKRDVPTLSVRFNPYISLIGEKTSIACAKSPLQKCNVWCRILAFRLTRHKESPSEGSI